MASPEKASRFLVSLFQVQSGVCVQSFLGFMSGNYFEAWAQAAESGPGRWVSATNWPWFPGHPVIPILRTEFLDFSKGTVTLNLDFFHL